MIMADDLRILDVLEASASGAAARKVHRLLQRFTDDGGIAVWMVNDTGALSVKGMVISPGSVTNSFDAIPADDPDPIGVVYDGGIGDGELCRVVVSGTAYVLLQDSTASTVGNWVRVSATQAGRVNATASAPPGGGVAELDQHVRECGHCLETVGAGTDKLMLMVVHFL
jgi:hypothetical protein